MSIHKLRRSLSPLLLPFSLFYGIAVSVRNKLFDLHILKSTTFNFPVISVGNITVGGTGKTPHVEYLVELLSKKFRVSILSRGYKRKTKGFHLADKKSTPEEIGDESFQVFSKFRNVTVAVDEDRVHGIHELKKKIPDLQAVILDDAFQHRYVTPGVSIVLIDYYRPIHQDCFLPAGNLRESTYAIKRANIVIVTKVPEHIKPIEKRLWKKDLKLFPYQFLYFTTFGYGRLIPVFKSNKQTFSMEDIGDASVLLVTGIANPAPLLEKVTSCENEVFKMYFPDHHDYNETDLNAIKNKYEKLKREKKIIITTEKDAIKLGKLAHVDRTIKEKMYYLPVHVKFLDDKQGEFDTNIINYVATNKEINRLHK